MPYVCVACKSRIDVGLQEMVVDGGKNPFHKSCFNGEVAPPPPPSPLPPSPPPPSPVMTYPFTCQRCGAGITATAARSCSRCYLDLCPKCEAAGCCGDRPAHIGEKTYCGVCGKPCRAMCSYCKRYVHSGYGLSGTCGIQHEVSCSGARESRESTSKPPAPGTMFISKEMKKPFYDTVPVRSTRKKSGKKKTAKKKARSRR